VRSDRLCWINMPAETQNAPLHPMVLWAQRDSLVYLTISVEDMKIDDLTVDDKSLHIKGSGGSSNQVYESTLEFYEGINGSEYRRISNSRHVELVIPKATNGWWPRLLKDSKKVPWIKVDFNKWKDEDDEDDGLGAAAAAGGEQQFDLNSMMASLGGGAGGMPGGMGGMGGMPPNLDDFEDSDNDEMPDLEDEPDEEEGKKAAGPSDGQEPTTSGENNKDTTAADTK